RDAVELGDANDLLPGPAAPAGLDDLHHEGGSDLVVPGPHLYHLDHLGLVHPESRAGAPRVHDRLAGSKRDASEVLGDHDQGSRSTSNSRRMVQLWLPGCWMTWARGSPLTRIRSSASISRHLAGAITLSRMAARNALSRAVIIEPPPFRYRRRMPRS